MTDRGSPLKGNT